MPSILLKWLTGEGTGFSFANINAHELLFYIKDALKIYKEDKEEFKKLVANAMAQNNDWEKSCEKYLNLYDEIKAN